MAPPACDQWRRLQATSGERPVVLLVLLDRAVKVSVAGDGEVEHVGGGTAEVGEGAVAAAGSDVVEEEADPRRAPACRLARGQGDPRRPTAQRHVTVHQRLQHMSYSTSHVARRTSHGVRRTSHVARCTITEPSSLLYSIDFHN